MPIILAMFAASNIFVDDKGRLPKWMITVKSAVFEGVWVSYDNFFKKFLGDGERTQEGRDNEAWVEVPSEKSPLLRRIWGA